MPDKNDDTRTAAQIKAEMDARRARLAANVENLVSEVHPTAMKNRAIDDAKSFAASEFHQAKTQIKDATGWRSDRLAAVGAAVVGVIGFIVVVRAISKRGASSR